MKSKPIPSTKGLTAYKIGETAELYGVTLKVFIRWLQPHNKNIGKCEEQYYNIKQIKYMLKEFGRPDSMKGLKMK